MSSASIHCRLLALLFVGAAGLVHGQTNDMERPLSLSQCFRIALDHNFDVKIARFNPQIQQHNLSASYGAYEPSFAFDGVRGFSVTPVGVDSLNQPVAGPTSYGDSFTSGIGGILPDGMTFNLGGNLTGISESSPAGTTKEADAAAAIQLNQPLLRNAWIDSPRETIQVNKKLLKVSKLALTQQIMATLTSVELAYYNLIVAQEQVKVYEQATQLAQRLGR